MTTRILNRRRLREEADQAAAPEPDAPAGRGEAPAPTKAKKPRARKAPPRMRARWGVFDGGMKQVAVFDYCERAAALGKLADLLARGKGLHFLQIVKEPIPEPGAAQDPPPRAASRRRPAKG
jgi:hypothetical protein